MEQVNNHDLRKFIKRWTITVTYIAVVITLILGLRVYEVFWQ
jgi:hypothetical protein